MMLLSFESYFVGGDPEAGGIFERAFETVGVALGDLDREALDVAVDGEEGGAYLIVGAPKRLIF